MQTESFENGGGTRSVSVSTQTDIVAVVSTATGTDIGMNDFILKLDESEDVLVSSISVSVEGDHAGPHSETVVDVVENDIKFSEVNEAMEHKNSTETEECSNASVPDRKSVV